MKASLQLVMGKDPGADAFVWCHNPVKLHDDSMGTADDAACKSTLKAQLDALGNVVKDANGDPIYKARQADPRRSTIFWVNQEQNAGPLGYGPPLFDVETGETISGQAYIYGAALDTYAARSRDLVLLIAGKIAPDAYIAGQNVQDWVSQNKAGVNDFPLYGAADVSKKVAAMDFSWAKGQAPEAPIDGSSLGALLTSLRNREDAMYKGGIFGNNNTDLQQLHRDRLRGTQLEGMMVNSDVMQLSAGAKMLNVASPTPTKAWRSVHLRSPTTRASRTWTRKRFVRSSARTSSWRSRCTKSDTTWVSATTSALRGTR